ncbi:MAG: ABC transporter substrate-binding protein [Crocinitomicaceae bacterium]|nr:ABC transporter substrate-binding protein [Crocinitomicaceae bacterium]
MKKRKILKGKWLQLVCVACLSACGVDATDEARVFRYNESANLSSLDPAFARTLEPMWVVDQLFDGLVELDENLEFKPLLAQRFELDSSGCVWKFYLRDDVRFHAIDVVPGLDKGRLCTAHDVVYSLNRLRDPQVASSGAWILDAVDAEAPGGGILALHDDVVEITLREPFPPFLGLMSTAYANVVPVEAVEYFGADFRSHPVGTGPFQLAWWLEDVACVLHRNPHHWERDETGQSLPYLDAVHISFAADMGAEFQGLKQGKFDFMSGLHPAYMNELLDDSGELNAAYAEDLRLETVPFLKTDYIGFFTELSEGDEWLPWQDRQVRRALSAGIDRISISRNLRRGAVMPTSSFVPPVLLGLNSDSLLVTMEQVGSSDWAKAVLDSVRTLHPVPWPKLQISTTSDYTDICAALQYQWGQLGLEVTIDVVSAAAHRERVATGKAALFRKSWLADYPDAENFLGLFHSRNFAPSGPNYSHFSDEQFDRMFEQAMSTTDPLDRVATYRRMNDRISRSMPVIPLFHDQVTHFVRNEVTGWKVSPVNRLDLREVRKREVR